MKWLKENAHPFHLAVEVFGVLYFAVSLIWMAFGASGYGGVNLFFIIALTCIFLVSKQVFDSMRLTTRAQEIARTIADELVASSQELFTELYRKSPIPYILIDRYGNILSANIAALRLFDVTTARFEGSNLFAHLVSTADDHASIVEHKIHSGIALNDEELQVKRRDGTMRWVQLSVFFYKTKEGQDRGMLTLVDIDRHKQVDAAKSEFVSLASHQLRTPIAGMKWSAELLLMDNAGNLTTNQRRYIDRMLKSIHRMDLLVDDFLNVSRLELGTMVPEPSEFPVRPFFDDLFSEFTPQIVAKNLNVDRQYDPIVRTIVTDPNLLRSITSNLISNAVKYSRPNGTVTVAYRVTKDSTFKVAITDSGMGIPAAEQEHIFSKIFRASNARKEVPDGTGLGLYIVREAVKVLHGSVDLISQEDVGTTFTFTIPFQGKLQ